MKEKSVRTDQNFEFLLAAARRIAAEVAAPQAAVVDAGARFPLRL